MGLERQVAEGESGGEKDFPGVRTFAFMALIGALAVLISNQLGPWVGVVLFLATATFVVLRYFYDTQRRGDPGYTTEMASLCTFAVGALAQSGQLLVATVVTIAMVALLRSKRALHRAGELLSPLDMETFIRFLVISGIIFPLLPEEPIDPVFEVLRPRDIWRMVVLISGVSFVGYVLMRVRAGRSNHQVMGILGGLVSATAAALAYTRAAQGGSRLRRYETAVVLAASTSFLRLLLVVGIVGPVLLPQIALPLFAMSGVGFVLGLVRHRPEKIKGEPPEFKNPLMLRLALSFAGIYAAVLVLVAAARDYLGNSAIYALSAMTAFAGADAPSLSLARLALDQKLGLETAAQGIVIVAIAATLGKVGIVATVGQRPFVFRVAPSLLLIAATGIATLFLP